MNPLLSMPTASESASFLRAATLAPNGFPPVGAFTPVNAPGCAAAFEADRMAFADAGGGRVSVAGSNVVRWASLVPTRHGGPPLQLVNGHGNTPSLTFDGGQWGVWFAGSGALDFPGPSTTIPVNSRAFSAVFVVEMQALTNGPTAGSTTRGSILSQGAASASPFLLSDVGASGSGTGIWTATTASSGSLSGTLPIPTSRCVLAAVGTIDKLTLSVNENTETVAPLAVKADFLRALGGYFVSNYIQARILGAYYWTRALGRDELASVRGYCYARFNVERAPARRVFFVGDSLSAGSVSTNGLSYPRQLAIPTMWQQFNYGWAGSKTTDWTTAKLDTTVGQAVRAGDVVCLWLGTNDIDISTAPATVLANLQTIATYCRGLSSGVKVLVGTIVDRNGSANASFDADAATLNAAIRADSANLALDGVMDFQANTNLQDASNSTYFGGDQVHLTNTGYGVAASVAAPVILAV